MTKNMRFQKNMMKKMSYFPSDFAYTIWYLSIFVILNFILCFSAILSFWQTCGCLDSVWFLISIFEVQGETENWLLIFSKKSMLTFLLLRLKVVQFHQFLPGCIWAQFEAKPLKIEQRENKIIKSRCLTCWRLLETAWARFKTRQNESIVLLLTGIFMTHEECFDKETLIFSQHFFCKNIGKF